MILEIELVPKTSFFNNVRSIITDSQWDTIRRKCYKKANHICEICGGKGDKWPVECHEVWQYDDTNHIQKLIGFIALCPNCHKVKHYGYATITNNAELVFNYFIKINNINKEEAIKYIDNVFELWKLRSKYNWEVNIDFLDKYMET